MKIVELLNQSYVINGELDEVKLAHPKQIISSEIIVPVWQVKYSYLTMRKNKKEAVKYIFRHKTDWDCVDNEFNIYIRRFNEEHPDRKISNVEILDIDYLGELLLEIE